MPEIRYGGHAWQAYQRRREEEARARRAAEMPATPERVPIATLADEWAGALAGLARGPEGD